MKIFLHIICSYLVSLAWGCPAYCQLSPGPLSQYHKTLDNLENCKKCHDDKSGVSGGKCLSCHSTLEQRIRQNKGLHANPDYRECAKCHWEHQGRETEIILWPRGRENFDHEITGFVLTGKHRDQKCENCHQREKIKQVNMGSASNINLARTMLGLQQSCTSCHEDEHRAQLHESCSLCHDSEGWKPAKGFDHDKTAFPLLGLHKNISCEKCHATVIDNRSAQDDSYMKVKGIAFATCENCHKDPHLKRLGSECQSCHTPIGWKKINRSAFDHNRTDFPLLGKHQSITCEKCHLPGAPLKIAQFQKCGDCHQDIHKGQISSISESQDCSQCHNVNGFTPSTYTLADHARSIFPLQGAHRAVPCFMCHPKDYDNATENTIRFKQKSSLCTDCHMDPHQGAAAAFLDERKNCTSCHIEESWHQVTFDHDRTRYHLTGAHQLVACSKCHKSIKDTDGHTRLLFKVSDFNCQNCHIDLHEGQFNHLKADDSATVDCSLCHDTKKWKPSKFDHKRNSRFPLEGAHANVDCSRCHKPETINGNLVTRYRPISFKCESCHVIIKDTRS